MNYFTHSSPRSWKPNFQAIPAGVQAAVQQPYWLIQRSGEKAGSEALADDAASAPLPFAAQYMELLYPGHFQNPACGLRTITTLQA